ncbi:MAG: 23S rRNA (pseudouridine(1915)-N(3))-methyltransferase RlmH [Oscillospiraceae bacterium]|jgi:23S rRNA (pseudouridine1915-N3)-methyltransferase|nr:23S rRNA (pseudouridine(1915)-N(3))-methyltransferase RlmH [Oscillospiraceae bacterium]
MLNIKLICLGKMKEQYLIEAFSEYSKRMSAYCKLEVDELPEERLPPGPSAAQVSAALSREGAAISRRIPPGYFSIALCIEGRACSSEQFAAFLADCSNRGASRLCFIIGSSNGLDEALKTSADERLSLSQMTLPHHLARVMLAEQLYRALSLNAGGKYHK